MQKLYSELLSKETNRVDNTKNKLQKEYFMPSYAQAAAKTCPRYRLNTYLSAPSVK